VGWWKIQNSDDLVGDHAFDPLRDAATQVAQEYTREFGRPPTRSEWQRLIHAALLPIEDVARTTKVFLSAENARPRAVKIALEGLEEES
jgi:hypothetical protein